MWGGSLPGYAYRESSSVRWPPAAPPPHGFRAVSPPARVGFCTPAPKGPGVRRPGAPVAALGPAACEQPGAGSDSSAAALPPRPQGTWSHRPARLGALLRPRSHRCAARRRGSRLTPLAAASASWPHATPPVAPSPPRAGPASQGSRSWGGRGLRVPGRGGAEAARVDPRAAVTKRHRRGGLKRHLLPHSSEGGKSELKVSTELPRPRSLRGASLVPLPAAGGCRHTSHASARGGCTPISASVFTWLRPSRCP